MKLALLPTRTGGAAGNMAIDFLLLQRYPESGDVRFRHYDWRGPAFTFGYSQKIAAVRSQLNAVVGASTGFDLCRRPTGGGIVDHRDDWTYALVIPRGHPWEENPATQSYRAVHEAMGLALREQDVPAILKVSAEPPSGDARAGTGLEKALSGAAKESVCFERAETFDVVHASTDAKIAGAAQKRNKRGLLFQGSIWRPAVGAAIDWDAFEAAFAHHLAEAMGVAAEQTPWPEFNEDEVSTLTDQYASAEWLAYR